MFSLFLILNMKSRIFYVGNTGNTTFSDTSAISTNEQMKGIGVNIIYKLEFSVHFKGGEVIATF